MLKLELQATPEEVMRAVEALQTFCQSQGVPERTTFGLTLALEECGSNIVNYALRGDAKKQFTVLIEHAAGGICIELRDHGPEFDPTQAKERATGEDDPPGGWGLQLVRRYTDSFTYRRDGAENILRLCKQLNKAPRES